MYKAAVSYAVTLSVHGMNLTHFVNLSAIVRKALCLSFDIGSPVTKSMVIVWFSIGTVGMGCRRPAVFAVECLDV
jgi:hypothetical protein